MSFKEEIDPPGAWREDAPGSGFAGGAPSPRGSWFRHQPEEPAGVRALLRVAWRQRWLMMATVVGLTGASGLLLKQIAPRYTATALVMFNAAQARVVVSEAVKERLSASFEAVQSQIEIIRSRELAARVVQSLDLASKAEFNQLPDEQSVVASISEHLSGLLAKEKVIALLGERISGLLTSAFAAVMEQASTTSSMDVPLREPEVTEDEQRRAILDEFLDRLDVSEQGQSQVIAISFTSIDPATAQLVANGVAEAYLQAQIEEKTEIASRGLDWLETRLGDLRKQTEQSERAVGVLRSELGMADGAAVSLVMQQISDLNAQVQLARAERREATARLRQAQALIASSGGAASASEVLNSSLVQRLREQEAAVARQVREMASELGPIHPRMLAANSELLDIRERIREEADRIVTSLGNEVDVVAARERSLEESIAELRTRAGEFNATEIELTLAEREATANRSLYETFLARAREVSSQVDFQQPDSQVVSYADLPVDPSFPRIDLALVVAFLGSSFASVFLGLARDHFTHVGFRTIRETEQFLGIPALALMPDVGSLSRSGQAPVLQMMEKPGSVFAESIRQISLKLTLSGLDEDAERAKIILVTSALAGEGKTSTAVCLARQRAALCRKVVLVDADLWRPTVHQVCGLERQQGLLDYLAGGVSIDTLLKVDPESPLHIITAGGPAPHARELLASRRTEHIINELAKRYDCVIVDSPPVLAIAATRALARLAHQTVLVARWQRTRREVAATATGELLAAGANLVGVILSMVDPKKSASYSYSDAAYRDKAMQSYYLE